MTNALTVLDVTRHHGSHLALDHISFCLPAGGASGLLGPNGAGKTTLFSLIAGYLRHETGRILVYDQDIAGALPTGSIGILPQDAIFHHDLNIIDQLCYMSRLAGRNRSAAEREVYELLERVGLQSCARQHGGELSHGMFKRLGVAQAFIGQPRLVLLDEPTAGLDPANAHTVRTMIRELCREQSRTVIISSHDLTEIQDLCQHVAILDRGKVVSCAPIDAIAQQPRSSGLQCRIRCTTAWTTALADTLRNEPWVLECAIDQAGGLNVTVSSADHARQLQQWCISHELLIQSFQSGPSLIEHFMAVTTANDQ